MCGSSGDKKWTFQLCISQTSQADRTTGNDDILGSFTVGYTTTTSYPQGRLSNNKTINSKVNDFYFLTFKGVNEDLLA